jgi:hypothetical protein
MSFSLVAVDHCHIFNAILKLLEAPIKDAEKRDCSIGYWILWNENARGNRVEVIATIKDL